jgi:hypothetical protein
MRGTQLSRGAADTECMSNRFQPVPFHVACTQRLFDEPVPRSDETIEHCTAEAAAKTKRLARQTGFGFIVFIVLATIAMGVAELKTTRIRISASWRRSG